MSTQAAQTTESKPIWTSPKVSNAFLEWSRPGGPWVLTAILPDGPTITETLYNADEVTAFILKHNVTRNIYYTPNRCRGRITSKPSKTDIERLEFVWCDGDPRDDETPDKAKERYQEALTKAGLQGVLVDSGNGLQILFKLQRPVELSEPTQDGVDDNGKPKFVFSPNDQRAIDEVESRCLGLNLMLGAPRGTQNIDRLLRLPGTTNHPNKKKLSKGRKQCPARLAGQLEVPAYPLAKFPKDKADEPEPLESVDFDTADDGEESAAGYDQDDDDQDRGDDRQASDEDELERTIRDGGGNRHGPSRSEAVFFVACELVRRGKTNEQIADILCDLKNGISESIREAKDPRRATLRQAAKARKKVGTSKRRNVDGGDPLKVAMSLITAHYTQDGKKTLHRHRGTFWQWTGTYYKEVTDEYQRSVIWKFLQHSRPNVTMVNNVFAALVAYCQLEDFEPPFWISKQARAEMPTPSEFFACDNGLLHLPTKTLYPLTPDFFGLCASDVIYDPEAKCPQWEAFIDQALDKDAQTIQAAQEWFGYTLSPDTSQQKILMAIGQKRTGKGTFARVQTRLLGGSAMVGGPTLAQLAKQFGLWPLITKPLAIVTDAESKQFKSEVVGILKAISGEDNITVDRKNTELWTGKMPTRFMIAANQLPIHDDVSGALAGRYIVIKFPNSFYGKEDTGLTDKLIGELSGILNWAIEGYQRLRERGRFVQPEKSKADIEHIADMGSPVSAFVRDCCEVGQFKQVPTDEIYAQYIAWQEREGHKYRPTKNIFGRDLHAIVPGFRKERPRVDGKRVQMYFGIALQEDPPPIDPNGGGHKDKDAGPTVKVDLVFLHNTEGSDKAKGAGASKYGDPNGYQIIWLPNTTHDVERGEPEGLRDGCCRVIVGEKLWREKQTDWKPADERDRKKMDVMLGRAEPDDDEDVF